MGKYEQKCPGKGIVRKVTREKMALCCSRGKGGKNSGEKRTSGKTHLKSKMQERGDSRTETREQTTTTTGEGNMN